MLNKASIQTPIEGRLFTPQPVVSPPTCITAQRLLSPPYHSKLECCIGRIIAQTLVKHWDLHIWILFPLSLLPSSRLPPEIAPLTAGVCCHLGTSSLRQSTLDQMDVRSGRSAPSLQIGLREWTTEMLGLRFFFVVRLVCCNLLWKVQTRIIVHSLWSLHSLMCRKSVD